MKPNLKQLYENTSDFVEHFGVYGIEGIPKSDHEHLYGLISLAQDFLEIASELNIEEDDVSEED